MISQYQLNFMGINWSSTHINIILLQNFDNNGGPPLVTAWATSHCRPLCPWETLRTGKSACGAARKGSEGSKGEGAESSCPIAALRRRPSAKKGRWPEE